MVKKKGGGWMRSFWKPGKVCLIGVGLGVVGFVLSAVYVFLGLAYYFEFVVFPVWVLVFGVLVPVMGFVIADMKYRGVGGVMLVGSGVMVLALILRMALFVMYAFIVLLYWWYYGPVIWLIVLVLGFVGASGFGGFLCIISGILVSELGSKSP
jgi:hypothetical protein